MHPKADPAHASHHSTHATLPPAIFPPVSKNSDFFSRCTKDANVAPAEVAKNGGF